MLQYTDDKLVVSGLLIIWDQYGIILSLQICNQYTTTILLSFYKSFALSKVLEYPFIFVFLKIQKNQYKLF